MDLAVFSTKPYDRAFLTEANEALGGDHQISFFEPRLDETTVPLVQGFDAVCAFVNDDLNEAVIDALADAGVRLVALRCAGYNQVDLAAAARRGLTVARVPGYSPHAVAEHAVALILSLNRQIHRASNRVRELNFALDGLIGFDLRGRTVGVVGTGQIGAAFARIMRGFGCTVVATDPYPDADLAAEGVIYQDFERVIADADIVSLHCPLTPATHHLIDADALALMRPGVMLINTSRGGLVNTQAVIDGLKSGQVGYLGLDVYEEEANLFFEDLSNVVLSDDTFARLLTFPNVVITGHQGFFTEDALTNIARTTITNLTAFETEDESLNRVEVPVSAPAPSV